VEGEGFGAEVGVVVGLMGFRWRVIVRRKFDLFFVVFLLLALLFSLVIMQEGYCKK